MRLLELLDSAGYDFVPPTPSTHIRALANGSVDCADIHRRLFGWSDLVSAADVPAHLLDLMCAAGVLQEVPGGVRSSVRVARRGDLFLHSRFPTEDFNAVFFGPDSYRFAALIEREIIDCNRAGTIIDVGTGSGIGALTAAKSCPDARVFGTDINPWALELASINAEYAGCAVAFIDAEALHAVRPIDIAIANPPYIIDSDKRQYRDGGDALGTGVAIAMASSALGQLAPGGRLILYTGSPIVNGRDPLKAVLEDLCRQHGATLRYGEIDPDVFGEELEHPAYAGVDRIALVAAIAKRAPS